jgi:hypothetical protein
MSKRRRIGSDDNEVATGLPDINWLGVLSYETLLRAALLRRVCKQWKRVLSTQALLGNNERVTLSRKTDIKSELQFYVLQRPRRLSLKYNERGHGFCAARDVQVLFDRAVDFEVRIVLDDAKSFPDADLERSIETWRCLAPRMQRLAIVMDLGRFSERDAKALSRCDFKSLEAFDMSALGSGSPAQLLVSTAPWIKRIQTLIADFDIDTSVRNPVPPRLALSTERLPAMTSLRLCVPRWSSKIMFDQLTRLQSLCSLHLDYEQGPVRPDLPVIVKHLPRLEHLGILGSRLEREHEPIIKFLLEGFPALRVDSDLNGRFCTRLRIAEDGSLVGI